MTNSAAPSPPTFIEVGQDDGQRRIAVRARAGGAPGLFWLGGSIDVGCPVRILQGAQDRDVPWKHALALAHRLPADDVVLTVIQDGDHRLSRPQDIARIIAAVEEIR